MTAIVELKDATVKVNNGFDTEKIILDHVNLTIREGDFPAPFPPRMVIKSPSLMVRLT